MLKKRLQEIEARKAELGEMLRSNQEMNLDDVQKELDTLEEEKRNINDKLEMAERINAGKAEFRQFAKPNETVEEDKFDTLEYRRAFMKYATRGIDVPTEYRADANTLTTDVGTVIPTTIVSKIIEKLEATGMILPLVNSTTFKGGVSIPTSNAKPVATWVAEGSGSDKQKKTTGSITFAYHKLRCAISMSLEVTVVTLSMFEDKFIKNVVKAMVKALEQAIISGDGSGKPTGILTETPETGQAFDISAATGLKIDDIEEAEGALPIEYEANAKWIMTKKTFMAYKTIKDAQGQPVASVTRGTDGKLIREFYGRDAILCNYIPSWSTASAGEVFAFMFDFDDYMLNTNYAMGIKRYEDNDTDDQVMKSIMLVDGKVTDKNSLVTLTKKA